MWGSFCKSRPTPHSRHSCESRNPVPFLPRLDPGSEDALALPELTSLVVADVSFISLTRLLRGMAAHVSPGGDILPMVKPQFELSPREVPRGVVHDPAARARAVARVREHAESLGLECLAETESVLVGPSGNHEFFLHLRAPGGVTA